MKRLMKSTLVHKSAMINDAWRSAKTRKAWVMQISRPDTSLSRFFTPPLLLRRSLFRPEFLIERLGLAKLLGKGSVARSQIKLMAHLILICAENNTDV